MAVDKFASRLSLSRRNSQNPDQHAEQNQRAKKRERGVKRMELKVGIALQTMPGRQHGTSFCLRMATDGLSTILSHFREPGSSLSRACDKPVPWLTRWQ